MGKDMKQSRVQNQQTETIIKETAFDLSKGWDTCQIFGRVLKKVLG